MGQSRVASVPSASPRLGLPHPWEAQDVLLSRAPLSHPELRSDHVNSSTTQTLKGPPYPHDFALTPLIILSEGISSSGFGYEYMNECSLKNE